MWESSGNLAETPGCPGRHLLCADKVEEVLGVSVISTTVPTGNRGSDRCHHAGPTSPRRALSGLCPQGAISSSACGLFFPGNPTKALTISYHICSGCKVGRKCRCIGCRFWTWSSVCVQIMKTGHTAQRLPAPRKACPRPQYLSSAPDHAVFTKQRTNGSQQPLFTEFVLCVSGAVEQPK